MTDLEKYKALLTNVKGVRNNLKKAADKIDVVDGKVVNAYSVDEISGDDGYLTSTKSEILSIYNYLVNYVIPEIEKKIREHEATGGEEV